LFVTGFVLRPFGLGEAVVFKVDSGVVEDEASQVGARAVTEMV
jgi:hypothetical protein